MSLPLLFAALAAAPVPKLTAGPDLADQAIDVDAPIQRVTVFSDRATVLRRATVPMGSAIVTARLPELPGNTSAGSVRVSARGAQVWRIEVAPVSKIGISIPQADAWLEQIDELTDEIARVDARIAAVDFRLSLLMGINPAAPVPEAQRDGRPRAPLAPSVWQRAMAFLSTDRAAARAARRGLVDEREKHSEALAQLQREIARLNQGGFSSQRQQVVVILQKEGKANATLEVEYTVPGASWRPAYDLTYLAAKNQVVLETSARVTQASGEDWSDVELLLSTAIPGANIALPKLLTWTLGEAKELIPQPRPRTALPRPQVFAPPRPVVSERDRERAERIQLLQQRLQLASNVTKERVTIDFSDANIQGELVKPEGAYIKLAEKKRSRPPSRRSRRMQSDAPSAAPSAPMPMDEADVMMSESIVTTGASAGSASAQARLRASGPSGSRRGLALYESAPPPRFRFSDQSLPAMLAGGFDYIYEAQTQTTVPSDGREVRVPLSADQHPVQAYYEATPSLAKTAYLEATVTNQSKQPILGGPVTIFVGDQFSGDGSLATTGPGGDIELPLGADEDVKVERRIEPQTETSGVIMREDITTYRVVLQVANFKRRAITVGVMEPLPKTTNEDIEIELVSAKPKQTKGPDEQGLMRWDVELKPGEKKTIELVYKIERPENWQLYQR